MQSFEKYQEVLKFKHNIFWIKGIFNKSNLGF